MSDPSIHRDETLRPVVVIGAGVIGLATALELAAHGARVIVLDVADGPGAEASGAAAGIIAPINPWDGPTVLQQLASESLQLYPQWCRRIAELAGTDPGLQVCGMRVLAPYDAVAASSWSAQFHHRMEVTDEALWLPDIGSVTPAILLGALVTACESLRVRFCWGTAVDAIRTAGGCLTGVQLQDGSVIECNAAVVAAGAWAVGLLKPLGVECAVHPVRGEIIELQGPIDILSSIIVQEHRYLVPRPGGRIVVGSTAEAVGFDRSTTAGALEALREFADEVLPESRDYPVVGHWAGLRPGSPDGVPSIGPVPGVQGLWVAVGHFRNGLTLAPASAQRLVTTIRQVPDQHLYFPSD